MVFHLTANHNTTQLHNHTCPCHPHLLPPLTYQPHTPVTPAHLFPNSHLSPSTDLSPNHTLYLPIRTCFLPILAFLFLLFSLSLSSYFPVFLSYTLVFYVHKFNPHPHLPSKISFISSPHPSPSSPAFHTFAFPSR